MYLPKTRIQQGDKLKDFDLPFMQTALRIEKVILKHIRTPEEKHVISVQTAKVRSLKS